MLGLLSCLLHRSETSRGLLARGSGSVLLHVRSFCRISPLCVCCSFSLFRVRIVCCLLIARIYLQHYCQHSHVEASYLSIDRKCKWGVGEGVPRGWPGGDSWQPRGLEPPPMHNAANSSHCMLATCPHITLLLFFCPPPSWDLLRSRPNSEGLFIY